MSKRALVSYRLLREPSGAWQVRLDGQRGEYRFPSHQAAVAWLAYALEFAEPVTA